MEDLCFGILFKYRNPFGVGDSQLQNNKGHSINSYMCQLLHPTPPRMPVVVILNDRLHVPGVVDFLRDSLWTFIFHYYWKFFRIQKNGNNDVLGGLHKSIILHF